MIRVESIMSMNVVSISHTTTVGVAEMCLAEARLTGAPMVDETGKLLGVISVTDILQHHAAGLDPDSDTVAAVGTKGAITIDAKASVHDAAKLMTENRVRRLVVVDGDEVVGLFSATDVVALVAKLDSEDVKQWSLGDDGGR